MLILTEAQARANPICVGCHKPKPLDHLVCWQCFKYSCPTNPKPLKYSGLSFEDWQRGKTLKTENGGI